MLSTDWVDIFMWFWLSFTKFIVPFLLVYWIVWKVLDFLPNSRK